MSIHPPYTRDAIISFNSSGDNTVIAAISPTGPIHIHAIVFTVDGATNVTFKDSVVGNKTGSFVLTGNGSSFTLPMSDNPWFSMKPGSAFVINSSSGVNVGGILWYSI